MNRPVLGEVFCMGRLVSPFQPQSTLGPPFGTAVQTPFTGWYLQGTASLLSTQTSSFLAEALTPESACLPPALAMCRCIGNCHPTHCFLRNCILLWFPCNAWARRQHQLGFEGFLSEQVLILWFLTPASVEGPAAWGIVWFKTLNSHRITTCFPNTSL